ncbi:hypothetical protein RHSIM_Rhsim09G0135300 [Rhododendron simsii]|uniref:non-specific serine/threonine protein kinase n=1 Tax=Rhododendron simsii TaxID=118357 RepID=A0A834LEC5_RHOSS|nr:hypothetical protein RHSIM_Rhsim09G0135300 [Rhododendron simsii]
MGGSPIPSVLRALAFYFVSLLDLVQIVRGQNVSALNSVFNQWRISATEYQWNISGEPCSGAAIDTSVLWDIYNTDYNPGIRCDCNGTVCHITQLKVIALDVFGGIPEELWSLTFLTNLNLGQNYLTGPLSSSIANLTQMQWMGLGTNALSGEVPKELGKLTNLTVLNIGTNNFSGSLPLELGYLVKLQIIYFDSSGVSGAIPSTFAGLQNLQILWGSDNELTGSIPEFIGNLSKLFDLRFQGNAFEGGIPSTFSKLTLLTDLWVRISDLSNGSSSLVFLKNTTSLKTFGFSAGKILRNNHISGTIPSNIGDYQSLSQLDLSFNNLTGPIPDSLFNSNSLVYLFLGNNKLNGTPPVLKSPSLLHIDVSYNQLSPALPSWAINSVMATGFDCIPENLPCLRSSPKYSDFAINCGGPKITSNSQIVYEGDNEALGPATYYEASTKRWAVSNVGQFNIKYNAPYTSVSSSPVITNSDSRLFQTARISPGSLRYFGLGLENGNYNVTLHFAETEFSDLPTWTSLGRRVFNIYIQVSDALSQMIFFFIFDVPRPPPLPPPHLPPLCLPRRRPLPDYAIRRLHDPPLQVAEVGCFAPDEEVEGDVEELAAMVGLAAVVVGDSNVGHAAEVGAPGGVVAEKLAAEAAEDGGDEGVDVGGRERQIWVLARWRTRRSR